MRPGTPHYTLLLAIGLAFATNAVGAPKGVLIYSDYGGMKPHATAFETISWKSGLEGVYTTSNHQTDTFPNPNVAMVLYFDKSYYEQVTGDPKLAPMRAMIRGRETLIDATPTEVWSADDAARLSQGIATIERLCAGVPTLAPNVAQVLQGLREQVDHFQRGDRKRAGKWLSPEEVKRVVAESESSEQTAHDQSGGSGSFVTKTGATFKNVQITSVTDDRISIRTDSGIDTIALSDLSADLKGLPPTVAETIRTKRAMAEEKRRQQIDFLKRGIEDAKGEADSLAKERESLLSKLPTEAEVKNLKENAGVEIEFRIERKLDASKFSDLKKYGDFLYQVRLSNRDLAILATSNTRYTSSGWSSMRVTYEKNEGVVLEDGFDDKVPVIVETAKEQVGPYLLYLENRGKVDELGRKISDTKDRRRQLETGLNKM